MSYRPMMIALVALATLLSGAHASGGRPDILLVIGDDMDYEHLGYRNPAAHTPTLDRIRARGVLFPNGWATPRCAPSLASILTGLHPHEHGRYYNSAVVGGDRRIDVERTFSRRLQDHGYRCYAGGKWWFGPPADAGFEASQTNRGTFVRRGQDHLFDWVDSLAPEDNFMIWWAPLLPHTPHNPPTRYLDQIDESRIQVPSYIAEQDREEFLRTEERLLAMTAWMDDGLNSLLEHIVSRGRHGNLLILFMIDNGWANGRVSKGSPYEKGLQTPFLLFNPGVLPEGETRPHLVSVVDLFATILDYAGIPAGEATSGRSLRIPIENPLAPWRRHLISLAYPSFSYSEIWHEEAYAITLRDAGSKLIVFIRDVEEARSNDLKIFHLLTDFPERRSRDQELYLLGDDPYEEHNLIDDPAHRDLRDAMRKVVKRWWLARGGEVPPLPR